MINATVKNVDGTNYITFQGRIDMSNAAKCEQILIDNMADVNRLVLDLQELTFIDSTGIGSLVGAIKYAFGKDVDFKLVNIPEAINEIFEVIGVYEVLNLRSDL